MEEPLLSKKEVKRDHSICDFPRFYKNLNRTPVTKDNFDTILREYKVLGGYDASPILREIASKYKNKLLEKFHHREALESFLGDAQESLNRRVADQAEKRKGEENFADYAVVADGAVATVGLLTAMSTGFVVLSHGEPPEFLAENPELAIPLLTLTAVGLFMMVLYAGLCAVNSANRPDHPERVNVSLVPGVDYFAKKKTRDEFDKLHLENFFKEVLTPGENGSANYYRINSTRGTE